MRRGEHEVPPRRALARDRPAGGGQSAMRTGVQACQQLRESLATRLVGREHDVDVARRALVAVGGDSMTAETTNEPRRGRARRAARADSGRLVATRTEAVPQLARERAEPQRAPGATGVVYGTSRRSSRFRVPFARTTGGARLDDSSAHEHHGAKRPGDLDELAHPCRERDSVGHDGPRDGRRAPGGRRCVEACAWRTMSRAPRRSLRDQAGTDGRVVSASPEGRRQVRRPRLRPRASADWSISAARSPGGWARHGHDVRASRSRERALNTRLRAAGRAVSEPDCSLDGGTTVREGS